MTLTQILIFSLFGLLVGQVLPRRWLGWALLAGSLAAIYWMQPSSPVRNLNFWLPSASIALTVFVWAVTQKPISEGQRLTVIGAAVIAGVILGIGLQRYLGPLCCLTAARPPDILRISIFIVLAGLAALLPYRLLRSERWPTAAIFLILALFTILKAEPLARAASAGLRLWNGQDASLASALDLPWLGFSYLAFRLLHVLRDYQMGKLPAYALNEFAAYALFFPSYTAGPIDRIQHFSAELKNAARPLEDGSPWRIGPGRLAPERWADLIEGGWRIFLGIFKKFALADALALIALNGQNAAQVKSGAWLWVLLYAYALRIYFDFSGYTDIALGLGRLVGMRLPENFERPYWKTNLTAFWNSWHITLAQWFRAYYFNPLIRSLRSRPAKPPIWVIVLLGQISTMVLIGLWHGMTWNFAVWGAWHGLGLFIHNRWSEWLRPRLAERPLSAGQARLLSAGGWLLTFNYICLGWVWFALPEVGLALQVLRQLFGIQG